MGKDSRAVTKKVPGHRAATGGAGVAARKSNGPASRFARGGVFSVPLDQLRFDAARQARAKFDHLQSDEYAARMQAGDRFPRLKAFFDGKEIWVWDGTHTGDAHRRAKHKAAEVEISPGTRRDAFLAAAGANAAHGLNRSNADKRCQVLIVLADEEAKTWSDRRIAEHCKVDKNVVSRIRADLPCGAKHQGPRLVKRNGKVFPMRTGGINADRPITPKARDLLRDTALADKVRPIDGLAKLSPRKQRHAAAALANGDARTIAQATRLVDRRKKAQGWKHAAAAVNLDADACRILVGDCRHELDQVDDRAVALCFTDPPYGTGDDYHGFDDKLSRDQLLKIIAGFAKQLVRVLTPTGSALVMMSSRYARHVGNLLEAAGLHDRGPLVWAESFGLYNSKRYTDSYRVIHWFSRHASDFTFNWQDRRAYVPSCRAKDYDDDRRKADTKLPPNVWGLKHDKAVARLVDNSRERSPDKIAPNQLPVKLVERAVLLHSNENDLVLDGFHGTGTTAVAALLHGRRYVGVELDGEVAERSREWIKARLSLFAKFAEAKVA